MVELPFVSRALYRLAIERGGAALAEIERMRHEHRQELADLRAVHRAELDGASVRLRLSNDVALAMARQAEASLQTSRDALKDAVDMARAAAQAMHGPAIPDELPEPDSIAEADRRVARDRRNEDERARGA